LKPCISQACTLTSSFSDDVANFAEAGWPGVEVWLTKLEQYLEKHSVAETRRLLGDSGLSLPAASYQGGLLLSQGEERKAHFDSLRRRLELCQGFGIATLLVAADFISHLDATALERAVVSLKQAAQWAAGFDVRLALEFRGKASFCTSLETAVALVAECDEPNLGVCLDLFHYYTGPSKFEDLQLLPSHRLAFLQVCDLAGVPRELATDSDRIFPGDGDFQVAAILRHLRSHGYDGWVSLELFNPTLWQSPTPQVAELGLASLQRVLTEVAQPE
jgi:2-keto-myo-inositol isomerase